MKKIDNILSLSKSMPDLNKKLDNNINNQKRSFTGK